MTPPAELAFGSDVDPLRLARLLRRAHAMVLDSGVAPRVVRPVVSESWGRSVAAGVDPARPAPRLLDAQRTAERMAAHPLAAAVPTIGTLLEDTVLASGYVVAVSDADGVLLWSDGSPAALQSAVAPRFLPGFLCREDRIGTNALGTALVVDQPVQIFAAEHFNQLLHGWTCTAAPVHDPETGDTLGAINLSGAFRTAHVHGLALVAAVAKAAEGAVAAERQRADEQLLQRYRQRYGTRRRSFSGLIAPRGRVLHAEPAGWLGPRLTPDPDAERWTLPDGTAVAVEPFAGGYVAWRTGDASPQPDRTTVTVLGTNQASVRSGSTRCSLRLRHSEIVALLALHPAGMTVRDLSRALYGADDRTTTVRAEIARLRSMLPDAVLSRPYRLAAGVQVDVARVQRRLAEGDAAGAAHHAAAGPLLPSSRAPEIVAARDRLARSLPTQPSCSLPTRLELPPGPA